VSLAEEKSIRLFAGAVGVSEEAAAGAALGMGGIRALFRPALPELVRVPAGEAGRPGEKGLTLGEGSEMETESVPNASITKNVKEFELPARSYTVSR
jgi:hypothetical protein